MRDIAVLAIDPGPVRSALIAWDGTSVVEAHYAPNADILAFLVSQRLPGRVLSVVIEKICSYGMAVGEEVFETVFWPGRFAEAAGGGVGRLPRLAVKLHLCHDSRAKDGNIRQAIIDRFGGKEKAIGRKASRGLLYGISGDLWAALAVAITWWDTHLGGQTDGNIPLEVCCQ